jgi:hypothetical protein
LVCTYVVLFALFVLPMAAQVFAATFFGVSAGESLLRGVGLLSPFAATFSLPLQVEASDDAALLGTGGFAFFGMYVGATLLFNLSALLLLVWLFANRWRVSD